MEWLEGENLAERLHRGPLGLRDTVAVGLGVSAALAKAHERGNIHRDLKPTNHFLPDRDPARVVVLDFGIARRTMRIGSVTRTGVVIGTPQYMSPEQARGAREIGPPTDIFSLGCVLYECLAGAPPFFGEHMAEILIKVMFNEPKPIRARRGDVSEAFSRLIDRMLLKEQDARFSHGQALRQALRQLELPAEESIHVLTPARPPLHEALHLPAEELTEGPTSTARVTPPLVGRKPPLLLRRFRDYWRLCRSLPPP